jgi:hypothetical protein
MEQARIADRQKTAIVERPSESDIHHVDWGVMEHKLFNAIGGHETAYSKAWQVYARDIDRSSEASAAVKISALAAVSRIGQIFEHSLLNAIKAGFYDPKSKNTDGERRFVISYEAVAPGQELKND